MRSCKLCGTVAEHWWRGSQFGKAFSAQRLRVTQDGGEEGSWVAVRLHISAVAASGIYSRALELQPLKMRNAVMLSRHGCWRQRQQQQVPDLGAPHLQQQQWP